MIPLFKPVLTDETITEVMQCLSSGWWGLGKKVEQFEKDFARYIGVKHAVAVNSATTALHMAVRLLDIGLGDEVITTPITFVSTAHAVLYEHATPVFADVSRETLNLDPDSVFGRMTENTKAVIPVHLYGKPVDKEIFAIAKQFGVKVIEDCAHACGASYADSGVKCGAMGDISCFSFHAVKNLPCGDGGMLCTNDDAIAEKARKMRWLGISKDTISRCEDVAGGEVKYGWDYDVEFMGFKYHMNDISASIGIAQLKALEWGNDRRREIAKRYIAGLEGLVDLPAYDDCCSYHIFAIRTDKRDELNVYLKDKGISTGVHYKPLHLHTFYKAFTTQYNLPVAEKEWTRLLSLPIFPELRENEQEYIIESIKECLQ